MLANQDNVTIKAHRLAKRDDTWQVVIKLSNGLELKRSTGKKTREDAETEMFNVMLEVVKEISSGKKNGKGTLTLDKMFEYCRRSRWHGKDIVSKESVYKALLESGHFSANMDLTQIKLEVVQEFRFQQIERGLKGATINARLSLINVLLHEAEELGYGPLSFRIRRESVNPGRVRVISWPEEAKILRLFRESGLLHHDMMEDFVVVMIDTGFRNNEVLRVNPEFHINWDTKQIYCEHNKTNNPRWVPMSPRVQEVFRRRPKGFEGLTQSAVNDCWAWMRDRMDLPQDTEEERRAYEEFVPYACRHTLATRMALKGVPPFLIQAIMGHKSIKTTNRYINIRPEDLNVALEAIVPPSDFYEMKHASVSEIHKKNEKIDQEEESTV